GNSVTLYCTLKLQSAGWKFYWSKDTQSRETETETHSYTIRSVRVSDGGQYRCRAGRGNPVYYTHYSDALWVNVTENLKPVVIIRPDNHVFRGETVTFRCEIQGGGDTEWQYSWYKNNSQLYHNTQEFSLNTVIHEDSETAEAVVSVSSQNWLTEGDSVTLSCEIKSSSTGWTFSWYTDVLYRDRQSSLRHRPELLSDSSRGSGGSYTLSSVTLNHTGVYMCRAVRGEEVFYSQYSKDQPLWITERPKAVVTLKSDGQIFSGEKVTFTCEIQEHTDTEWTYNWYKDDVPILSYSENGKYAFTALESDSSKYNCSGQRKSDSQTSKTSNAVTLTVSEKPEPELTSDLKGAALTGNSVTLYCTLKLQSAGWKFYWSKDTQRRETETETHFYTIRSVNVFDGCQYRCRAGRGNPVYYTHYSDALWVNVTENLKPVVIIKPDNHVFRGETVTFRCEIQIGGDTEWQYNWYKNNNPLYHNTQEFSLNSVIHEDSGNYTCWTFSWYTDVLYRDSQGSYRHRPELLSDSSRGSGGSYTLSPVTLNHTGVYMCRAVRGEQVYYSQYSKQQPLWITGESPPVSLIINPSRTQHFIADSLSLSCKNQSDSTGWTVRGYTQNETWFDCSPVSGSTCNISSLSPSHTGVYWCQSESGECSNPVNITVHNRSHAKAPGSVFRLISSLVTVSVYLLLSVIVAVKCYRAQVLISLIRVGQAQERPKAVVTLQPDGQIFNGEKVMFVCEIQEHSDSEWTYNWYKDDVQIFPYNESRNYSFTALESVSGKYTCRGQRKSDSQSSETSNAVTLTVSEKPKPELTSDLKGAALTGNSVTLYCTLKLQSAGWKFYWSKDTQSRETETETHSYTIRSVSVSDGGQYRCRAGRGNPVYYTHYSDALWVNVTGESPPVSLIINPSRTQHFTADSISLSCENHRDFTGWTVRGYTCNETWFDCLSVSGSTCNISSLSPSHTGVYWCQSESGECSNPVNITVHNGDVILDSPVHPLTEGRPLTLHCLYRNTKISDSGVDFYKDDLIVQNQTTGEMIFSSVSKSDEGFYHCKHPERGESPKSWISVRDSEAPVSVFRLMSSLMTVSVYLLLTIVVAVKCYRARGKNIFSSFVHFT
ncbi:Fc receptor-like protein 5, partial [Silurus meridionalis]